MSLFPTCQSHISYNKKRVMVSSKQENAVDKVNDVKEISMSKW